MTKLKRPWPTGLKERQSTVTNNTHCRETQRKSIQVIYPSQQSYDNFTKIIEDQLRTYLTAQHQDLRIETDKCLTTRQSDEQYETIYKWQASRPRRAAETYLRDLITSIYITNSRQSRFVTLAGARYMFPPRGILKRQGLYNKILNAADKTFIITMTSSPGGNIPPTTAAMKHRNERKVRPNSSTTMAKPPR